ncbi:MAG: hypothetical protein AAGA31_16970 [Bacteroidota bacterium]
MRLICLLAILAFPCCLLAQSTTPHPLEGTWKLTRAKWGNMKEYKDTEREIYKIFIADRFYFLYFDGAAFSGAGGGSYRAGKDTFTETIDYFSWDSTAVGTQQQFSWTIEGDVLHQTGLIADADQYDAYVIDEYYVRVEPAARTQKTPLAGVWRVENATYGDQTVTADDNRWTIHKIFTPQYWYGAFFNAETAEFYGVGFGQYVLRGLEYEETILAWSWDQSAVGDTNLFEMEVKPTELIQRGEINSDKYQHYKIVEHFSRLE